MLQHMTTSFDTVYNICMNSKRRQFIELGILLLLLAGFVLLFFSTTSPLFDNIYGFDSAYYRFIGLSILNGKTPYQDIWENKGPVLYFIQMIGALHGTQNRKISLIFLMQSAAFLFIIFIMERIDRIINKKDDKRFAKFILLTICSLPVLAINLQGGNLTEDWSLPMISCSLYLFVRFAVNYDENHLSAESVPAPHHPRHYSFWHGICFALTTLIRVNNTISICAGLLVIGVILIFSKQWKNLFENILFGILGIAAAALPVFGWYVSRHSFSEMFYAIFGHSLKYAGTFAHTEYSKKEFISLYLPLVMCMFLIIMHFCRKQKLRLIDVMALLIVISNFLLLLVHNTCLHYFVIVFPVFLFVLILYLRIPNIPEILAVVILFIYLLPGCYKILSDNFADNKEAVFSDAKQFIPKDERDSMIAFDVTPEIYLIKGMWPCSRFAAYQARLFEIEPEFKEEFISDINEKKPLWLVKTCSLLHSYPDIQNIVDTDYSLVFAENNYCFYRKNETN